MAATLSSEPCTTDAPCGRELSVTRVFDAPRELVWRAWTEPGAALRWMGPAAHPATHYEQDLRPGGHWRGCLRGEDGIDLWQGGVYKEIIEPERLVFTFAWDGGDGQPDHLRGHETVVTVQFADEAGKTKMQFHQAVFLTEEQMKGHAEGWNGTFQRLGEYLTRN